MIADMAFEPTHGKFVYCRTYAACRGRVLLGSALTWIEQRLSESGLTIKQLVQSENQKQAADQVSMSNSISSLRFGDGLA